MVPGVGQEFVTGTVTRFQADDAEPSQPLASPFTLVAAERGTANATIEDALVSGKRTTISWSSGTPLPITGEGGLELGPVHVEVDRSGVTWRLDGTRNFIPGNYQVGAAVAVGTAGIADSRESVSFEADDQTVLVASGGVTVKVDPQTVDLSGPGKISVSGALKVQTADDTRDAKAVTFGPGPFTATLAPGSASAITLKSVLQGAVTAS